jgi:sugar phosphate isomerase/epimerase
MQIGVFTALYGALSLEEALDRIAALGVRTVELGAGGYVGTGHCDPAALLGDQNALARFRGALEQRGMTISALSVHGNPLHPDPAIADAHHAGWRGALELAQRLEVGVVVTFSGCPGDGPGARRPNWVTCSWPEDFAEIVDWQWRERVLPYWTEEAPRAAAAGARIGIEMHPGMVVYNPETFFRLRAAAGEAVCCNYDPSHMFWQGIDPIDAVRELGRAGALAHVHAKDTLLDHGNIRRNGVLDTKPHDRVLDRSWIFRTIGFGHGEELWRRLLGALTAVGYDGAISIEHEDPLLSLDDGLAKAFRLLAQELPAVSDAAAAGR